MDAGGENVLVSHYMTEMRGIGCNSAMVCTTKELNICGEICSMAASTFSISFCISWRTLTSQPWQLVGFICSALLHYARTLDWLQKRLG